MTSWTVQGILHTRILEWVAFPFSSGSSQPRDQTHVSHIAGGFFTSRATKEAQEHWSGWPIPSLGDLPDPGIEPGFPALQADTLPTELSGKPLVHFWWSENCKLDSGTLENKENWFSVFIIEISSQIIDKDHLLQLCTQVQCEALQNFKMPQCRPCQSNL